MGTAHQSTRTIGLLLLLATGCVGCGGPANEYAAIVTGTVIVDGELAKSGTVTFLPVKDGKPSFGQIHPDGSYSLRTGQGDLRQTDGGTVVPGEYFVTVRITGPSVAGAVVGEGGPPVPGPSLIASKYAQKSTTELRRTVKPGENVFVLELDAAERQPPGADKKPAATPADDLDDELTAPPASTPPSADPSAAAPNESSAEAIVK